MHVVLLNLLYHPNKNKQKNIFPKINLKQVLRNFQFYHTFKPRKSQKSNIFFFQNHLKSVKKKFLINLKQFWKKIFQNAICYHKNRPHRTVGPANGKN
jgi:hypothetical protein